MFELDPQWHIKTAYISHRPLPPQDILCGGVVVGRRYDAAACRGERVEAIHGDPAIQARLDSWWADYKVAEKAQRDAEYAEILARCAMAAQERKRGDLQRAYEAIFGPDQQPPQL